MNYFELLFTALAVVSVYHLIRVWVAKLTNKELFALLDLFANKDVLFQIRLGIEQFIVFAWFIWALYRVILHIQ